MIVSSFAVFDCGFPPPALRATSPVAPQKALRRGRRRLRERPMRAEAQAMVNEIEESLVLLRRRL